MKTEEQTRYDIKRLIRARRLKRWSIEQLAAKCECSANAIYKIESGLRASERLIFKMSKALDVPMEEILLGDGDAA